MIDQLIRTKPNGEDLTEVVNRYFKHIGDELGASDSTIQVAQAIYRRSLDEKVIEYSTVGQIVVASFHAAARIEGEPYEFENIANALSEDMAPQHSIYTKLVSDLELEVGPVDPKEYVPRYVSNLPVDDEQVGAYANEILEASEGRINFSGKSPRGLAAGAVYLASLMSGNKVTQQQVSDVSDVHIDTIRSRFNELASAVGIST
ncbi:hypothetical protein GCM10028857_20700 [Salinarchaeum chitinilyticum]